MKFIANIFNIASELIERGIQSFATFFAKNVLRKDDDKTVQTTAKVLNGLLPIILFALTKYAAAFIVNALIITAVMLFSIAIGFAFAEHVIHPLVQYFFPTSEENVAKAAEAAAAPEAEVPGAEPNPA